MKRHVHKVPNVITEAAAYLECSHKLVFVFALIYRDGCSSLSEVEKEMELWHKRDIIPEWLGDFCLDVLTGRIIVDMDINKGTWNIRRVYNGQD